MLVDMKCLFIRLCIFGWQDRRDEDVLDFCVSCFYSEFDQITCNLISILVSSISSDYIVRSTMYYEPIWPLEECYIRICYQMTCCGSRVREFVNECTMVCCSVEFPDVYIPEVAVS